MLLFLLESFGSYTDIYQMGIAERKQREKERMRRDILDTAMEMLVEDGFEKLSIRRIATAIEYSPATIYLYFKDKNEIFFHLHEEGFAKFVAHMKTAQTIEDPMLRLRRLGQIYLKFALEHREYYELMFIMKSPITYVVDEWSCGMQSYNILRETVQACLEQKRIPEGHLEAATLAVWSSVHGLASLVIRDRLKTIPEEFRTLVVDGALDYISKLNETLDREKG